MVDVKETGQYQLYLRVIDALNANGFDTIEQKERKKDIVRHSVRRGENYYGAVYVIANTGIGGWLGSTEMGQAINAGSTHERMLYTCELAGTMLERRLYNVKGFNPNDYVSVHSDTGIGGYCNYEINDEFQVNEWIPILKAVKQGKTPPVIIRPDGMNTYGVNKPILTTASQNETGLFNDLDLTQIKSAVTNIRQKVQTSIAQSKEDPKITKLRTMYEGLSSRAQKEHFITNLQKQLKEQGSTNKSYQSFLNECIRKYNTEFGG